MTEMSVDAVIDDIVCRIARGFGPEKIILFGSHARGDARPDSDVDLLVLFQEEVDNPRARAGEMHVALGACGVSKDIIVSTTARFERYKNVVNTVYWPAAREGRVVYERAA